LRQASFKSFKNFLELKYRKLKTHFFENRCCATVTTMLAVVILQEKLHTTLEDVYTT